MRHLLRNGILVIAVLLFLAWSTYPPAQKLRLGKDLRGGVTLVYAVQIDRSENTRDVLNQTIDVLKQRVDPQGLFEIRMVAQGNDRIEVTMPLPGPDVKALRDVFEGELAKLETQSISADEFERAMRLAPAERDPELVRLAAGNTTTLDKLQRAARALDDAKAARKAIELGEQTGQPDEVLDELAAQAAQAELDYDAVRKDALAAALDPETLRLALELPTRRRILTDENGNRIELPSDRERAMEKIRTDHKDLLPQIDAIEAAWNTYTAKRTSLDDTSDLKRLLAGAGILSFRIAVEPASRDAANAHPEEQRLREELREKGPRNVQSRDAKWLKINDPYNAMNLDTVAAVDAFFSDPASVGLSRGYVVEPYHGEFYMLCWDTRATRLTQQDAQWSVAGAFPTSDQLGRPAIGFEMDARGARQMGELTGPHVGDPMAVLLDDEVYTAPNINERLTRNIQISGDFSQEEISYVIRTLTAGSLQARLSPEPLSEITVAPDLGADNLHAGMLAGIAALITVSAFMILYYFGYGVVAVISLAANALIILGCMALGRAAFSLPGIAGVILTFGMAVDANVLIYERVREELRSGKDLRIAIKLGYEKALSSIVDGNVTNLIVCFVLAYTGTQEIKGFAITLGIGVVSTMFSALLISRIIFAVLTDHVRVKKMSMLPMAVPFIERLLHPKFDWIGFRYGFIVISTIYVGIGVAMCFWQGEKMLDTEFRGGTRSSCARRRTDPTDDEQAPPQRLARSRVAERVSTRSARTARRTTRSSRCGRRTSSRWTPAGRRHLRLPFLIKTYATQADVVRNAIIRGVHRRGGRTPGVDVPQLRRDRRERRVFPVESAPPGRVRRARAARGRA
ncbi:MAG: protein translocase subunit SecD [Phycisphaerales bacterium]